MLRNKFSFFGVSAAAVLAASASLFALGGQGYECATGTYKWDTGAISSTFTIHGNPPRIPSTEACGSHCECDNEVNPDAGKPFIGAIVAQKFDTKHACRKHDKLKAVQIAFGDIQAWAEALFRSQSHPECAGFTEGDPVGVKFKIAVWDKNPLENDPIYTQKYTIKQSDLGNQIGSNIRPLNFNCQDRNMSSCFSKSRHDEEQTPRGGDHGTSACDVSFDSYDVCDKDNESCHHCESCDTASCTDDHESCDCEDCYACADDFVKFFGGNGTPNNPRCALPHTRRVDYRTDDDSDAPNFYPQGSGFSQYPARFTTILLEKCVKVKGEFYVGIIVDVPGGQAPDPFGCGGWEFDYDFIMLSIVDANDPKIGDAGFENNTVETAEKKNPVIVFRDSLSFLGGGVDLVSSLDEALAIRAVGCTCD